MAARTRKQSRQNAASKGRSGTQGGARTGGRTNKRRNAGTQGANIPDANAQGLKKTHNRNNIGVLIFVAIFIYVVVCVVLYFRTNHIARYEVKKGALATNNIYRGVVIRDETPVRTSTAGYVNYYANEGERVAKGDIVYVIDETGRLNEELQNEGPVKNSLTDSELSNFRNDIANFMHGYDRTLFNGTYDFKNSLQSTVKKLSSANMLESIERLSSTSGYANIINYCRASETGVVSYWIDGYEDLTAEGVTQDVFVKKNKDDPDYEDRKKLLISNTLMATGDIAYKLSTNENWSVVIPIEDIERGAELEAEQYIRVRFLKNQYESWGAVKLLNNRDGNHYIQLSFTNSMIAFVSDRFLDVELLLNDESGLKIPNSAIVDKEFFLISKDYLKREGEGNDRKGSVIRQCVTESGDVTVEEIQLSFYHYDEEKEEYYVDASFLDAGDILHKEKGQDIFVVSSRATLTGVYNVNNGFADFRRINILEQNDEYAIVNANTRYGLNVYDYIALKASDVRDNQFINE